MHAAEGLGTGALQSAIFNSANFSSIATDANGVIQIFNVGAERMLGYTAEDVTNLITPADISDPQDVVCRAKALSLELGTPIAPGFEALVFKASRGIEDIYELTYIRKDGTRLPAVVYVTALRDAQGAIIGYLLIGTGNTARQQVEEERAKHDQRRRGRHQPGAQRRQDHALRADGARTGRPAHRRLVQRDHVPRSKSQVAGGVHRSARRDGAQAVRTDAAAEERRARGREPHEVRIPRQHVARATYTVERDHRVLGSPQGRHDG